MKSSQNIRVQYTPIIEQAIMGNFPTTKSLLPATNSQVQQARKVLMILIGVFYCKFFLIIILSKLNVTR